MDRREYVEQLIKVGDNTWRCPLDAWEGKEALRHYAEAHREPPDDTRAILGILLAVAVFLMLFLAYLWTFR